LHGDWEAVRSFEWEVGNDCFLDEGGIRTGMADFHDVQLEHPAVRKAQKFQHLEMNLGTSRSAHGERK
jgi:hypothetical protein